MADALFVRKGNFFVGTPHASGPWDAAAMHGGAPAGLLAYGIERADSAGPMQVTRLAIDLLRPVLIGMPLELRTRIVRPGAKVQIVESTIVMGETEVARATALRIRKRTVPVPPQAIADEPPPTAPRLAREYTPAANSGAFLRSNEIRFVDGDISEPGPATAWFRLAIPVIMGEAVSPLMRVAAAADSGNGVGSVLDRERFSFINPDLVLSLHRMPAGEWICLESSTWLEGSGIGVATTTLYYTRGRLGTGLQSLFIDHRTRAE